MCASRGGECIDIDSNLVKALGEEFICKAAGLRKDVHSLFDPDVDTTAVINFFFQVVFFNNFIRDEADL